MYLAYDRSKHIFEYINIWMKKVTCSMIKNLTFQVN